MHLVGQIHVVDEDRLYAEWGEEGEGRVHAGSGLIAARRALNDLHAELARQRYDQVCASTYSDC